MFPPWVERDTSTGFGTTSRDTSPIPMRLPASIRMASIFFSMALSASSSSGVSRPVFPNASAAMIITGMAMSTQLASIPSIRSRAFPVGSSFPVTAPSASRKVSLIGDAVDARITRILDLPSGSLYHCFDQRLSIDVVDAHGRGGILRANQAGLDRERADAREHVAAVGLGIDERLGDRDLREQVIHVGTLALRAADDRDLARQGIRSPDAVDLQRMRGAHDAEQDGVAPTGIHRQVRREEVRAPRSAAAHKHTRYLALHVQVPVSLYAARRNEE